MWLLSKFAKPVTHNLLPGLPCLRWLPMQFKKWMMPMMKNVNTAISQDYDCGEAFCLRVLLALFTSKRIWNSSRIEQQIWKKNHTHNYVSAGYFTRHLTWAKHPPFTILVYRAHLSRTHKRYCSLTCIWVATSREWTIPSCFGIYTLNSGVIFISVENTMCCWRA